MFKRLYKGILPTVLAAACCACAGGEPVQIGGNPNLTIVSSESLPVPTSGDVSLSSRPFVVGSFDILTIDVFGNEDLSGKEVQVDAGGRITFPLIGTVEVAGKTTGEIGAEMERLFRGQYIRNPQVSVNVKEINSQMLTISGEIKKPGVYPLLGEMTLLEAVARAEGWTEFSKKREVLVFRKVNGLQYAALYDVKAIERGQYADPELYANDTVIVGDSQARRNLKDILTVAPALLGPVIFLLSNSN